MSEGLRPVDILPVTQDTETLDRDVFLAERGLCDSILQKGPGEYEVQLRFPVIIGEVPDSEKDKFSNLVLEPDDTNNFSFKAFAEQLPQTTAIIKLDFELLGIMPNLYKTGRGDGTTFEVTRKKEEPSWFVHWHMDGIGAGSQPVPDMFYLIANKYPTKVFEGPVDMMVYQGGDGRLRVVPKDAEFGNSENLFNGRGRVACAPEFGIMRMNAMTIHSRPEILEETTRTIARLWVSPLVNPHVPQAIPSAHL